MKKTVKTFLVVFLVVLLVMPKSLAVEIANGENTSREKVTSSVDTGIDSPDMEKNNSDDATEEKDVDEEEKKLDKGENLENDDSNENPDVEEKNQDASTDDEIKNDLEGSTAGETNNSEVGKNDADVDNELNNSELVPKKVKAKTNAATEQNTYNLTNSTTGLQKINNVWRMVENGKVNYTYKGLGTNDWGTWYFENGEINFKFTGTYKDNNGDTWLVKDGQVEFVTGLRKIDNVWRKVENGKINYTYTGIGTNDWGTWYFENGEIKLDFTDTYYEGDKAYIVEEGKVYETVASDFTGMVKVNNITWRMLENGKVNYTYKGIGTNAFGTWYLENGEINFKFTGIYEDENQNAWAVTEGKVATGEELVKIDNVWRKVENGKINYTYTGIGTNDWGTWYLENGEINFDFTDTYYEGDKAYIVEEGKVYETVASDFTGMVKVNNTIWRMVENGKVNYTYRGIGTNPYGTWYLENGEINFKFTGTYKDENENTWAVTEGKVETEEELVKIDNVWRKVENGKINYTYTGIGTNDWGTWYFENGEIKLDFTDTYYEGDKAYIVEEGKVYETVASDFTGMVKVNNTIWRMVENGKVNYTYRGIGTNPYGTWYLENGEINFDFTDTYYEGTKAYIIENGKVYAIKEDNTNKVTKIVAKVMEQSSTYYCEDNNVVGTIVATNINGEDLTSRLTNLSCDVTGSYEEEGITDADSRVTVKVELNKNTGKYEIKLSASYPGTYTITPKATGDLVDATVEQESITVRIEDKTTVNKIKLIDKSTGKELENNTLELYSNKNNNYGIKVEFYHSYEKIDREVALSRTADEVTLEKSGEIFSSFTTLGDSSESPATGKNKVEKLHVSIVEVLEEKTGTLTIKTKAEGTKVVLTVKAKPVKIERLKVNNDTTTIELPIAEGSTLEIPIELLDELDGNKAISSDMIVKAPSQSQNGNIAIYIANSQYSAMTAGFIKMTYKPNSNDITSIVFELTTPAKTKAKEVFSQGIVFEFDSSSSETGRDKVILMPTNLE